VDPLRRRQGGSHAHRELFLGWLTMLALSATQSFLCILPFRGVGRKLALEHTTHFHPAAVSAKYTIEELQRFLGDCDEIGSSG
jgi:hypothetical protein